MRSPTCVRDNGGWAPFALRFATLCLALVAVSCVTRPAEEGPYSLDAIMVGADAVKTDDGLHSVRFPTSSGLLYVKAPRPHLYRYDKMVLAPVKISYRPGARRWRVAGEEKIRMHFARALTRELSKSQGWTLVAAPGEGVLLATIFAVDMELHTYDDRAETSGTAYIASSGEVTLVLDLRDSLTGEPLLRYAQKRLLPGGTFSGSNTQLERLMLAFDGFASDTGDNLELFHDAVERIQSQEAEADTPPGT